MKKVNQRDQLVVVMKYKGFITQDRASENIYSIPRLYKVTEEGPPENYFDISRWAIRGLINESTAEEIKVELPTVVAQTEYLGFMDGNFSRDGWAN